jgi:hypothetical protein
MKSRLAWMLVGQAIVYGYALLLGPPSTPGIAFLVAVFCAALIFGLDAHAQRSGEAASPINPKVAE